MSINIRLIIISITLIFCAAAHAEISGNISIYSKYIYRGMTVSTENDNTTLQGGFDFSHDKGFYVGYWGSNLGYGNTDSTNGFENDFYAGYEFSASTINLNLAAFYYYYLEVDDQDAPELFASIGFGPITAGLTYLAKDANWGNEGDTYWTLCYEADLPRDFTLSSTLGYYTYKDSGKFIAASSEEHGFRNLDFSISHPIQNTSASMKMTYIIGGEDRQGIDQKNALVLGLDYVFDL